MTTHVWALVKRIRYLRHTLAERLDQGSPIAPDVVREGDALAWALSRLLVDGEVEHVADRDDIVAVGFDWETLKRRLAQRQRRTVLDGLLPGSPAAVAVVAGTLEATEAEGRNLPTFTTRKP